jgi:hypothetical protein
MSKKNKKSEKKRKEGLFFYLLGGKLFTSNIFTKNALLLGLIAVYSFFYVSNRYQYEKELVRKGNFFVQQNYKTFYYNKKSLQVFYIANCTHRLAKKRKILANLCVNLKQIKGKNCDSKADKC